MKLEALPAWGMGPHLSARLTDPSPVWLWKCLPQPGWERKVEGNAQHTCYAVMLKRCIQVDQRTDAQLIPNSNSAPITFARRSAKVALYSSLSKSVEDAGAMLSSHAQYSTFNAFSCAPC